MLNLPDFSKAFEFENGFYLSCDPSRIGKAIAHYELFKLSQDVPGALVECGVFKGASLSRFACYRALFGPAAGRSIIGFDTFDAFPETGFEADREARQTFIEDAGIQSIGIEQLRQVLSHKKCADNVQLIAGDICETVPKFALENPGLKIALLNLDVDIYEPSVVILEHLYPRLQPGGVLMLDDYGVFPGETKAVDDFFRGSGVKIRRVPYAATPSYIIKE